MKTKFIELHAAIENVKIGINVEHIRLIFPVITNYREEVLGKYFEANAGILFDNGRSKYVRETYEDILSKIKKSQRFIKFDK